MPAAKVSKVAAQDWSNFAVITGSAAGALTGLLFVAVSLNRERIAGHPALRSEAAQTLVLFMLPLLLAVLLTLPGTSATALGIAIVVLAVLAGAVLILIGREKKPLGDGPEASAAWSTPGCSWFASTSTPCSA
jgi:modulator of FtsH protease